LSLYVCHNTVLSQEVRLLELGIPCDWAVGLPISTSAGVHFYISYPSSYVINGVGLIIHRTLSSLSQGKMRDSHFFRPKDSTLRKVSKFFLAQCVLLLSSSLSCFDFPRYLWYGA
jgi:hypothetical protein